MPTVLGSMRRLILAPSLSEVTFATRGFPATPSPVSRHLEAIPQTVVCGFEWAIETNSLWEIENRLNLVDPEMRGFAYEGAAMACTVLDVARPGTGHRCRDLLEGDGRRHLFLAYIGIGFAMARLPRALWAKVVPDLTESTYHPTMSWLAVDGYGFDLAYFDHERWVTAQTRPKPYAWRGRADYFPRAFDQGVGRALWFIHAGDTAAVAAAVGRFAADRQSDLWSGVGLAAAFAGGATPGDLARLRHDAGTYQPDLAQGAVFAAKARVYAGFCPARTRDAVAALTGLSMTAADEVADDVTIDHDGRTPAYEQWRRGVRAHFERPHAFA